MPGDDIMYILYGNGVDDDTNAIQELLDSGKSLVELPVPKKHYCISKTLKIHSNQTLKLGETTTIRLMEKSDCLMLQNAEEDAHDICIEGGIWDYNNLNQSPNPAKGKNREFVEVCYPHAYGDPDSVAIYHDDYYYGVVIRFYKVTRLSVRNLTVKDPVTYCIQFGYVKYFTVDNVRFDQNFGNPTAENMDGIHIDGGCRFGSIRNVQGTCYDDIVALNANDACDGPIEDIQIDGVFGDNSLRGVRLLSIKSEVNRISISNVFGTYYQNCIGLTYFYPRTGIRGKMSHISIRNIYGNNCARIPEYNKGDSSNYKFAFLWIDSDIDIDFLTVDNLMRKEEISNANTIKVCKNTNIKNMSVTNIIHQNNTGKPLTFFVNEGNIDSLYFSNIDTSDDVLLENNGTVKSIKEI